jgi:hypothetical protein
MLDVDSRAGSLWSLLYISETHQVVDRAELAIMGKIGSDANIRADTFEV